MRKARLYEFSLFLISLTIAFSSSSIFADKTNFIIALLIFWFFSSIYYRLRVFYKNGNTNIEYGISYDLSFILFTGPLGLLILESIYRFTVYFYRKWKRIADPNEFFDTLYNIGTFVITSSFAYFLFQHFHSSFQSFPYGYWVLLFILVCISSYISGAIMVLLLITLGESLTFKEGIDFIFKDISFLDYGKVAITNGLLFHFLQDGKWEMIISLFILNYIVNLSFYSKSQLIQNKLERDQFEQMAYTDFLTGVFNRTFMDKKMAELNQTSETVGIVVADIDKFKRINDSYNHAVGDKVIQHFAATLKGYLSEDDYVFRSGGEEFTFFIRKRNFSQTADLINRILSGIENNSVEVEYNGEKTSIFYTASFGLYFYKINELISIEKAYIQADELLLQSKQCGKNQVSMVNDLINIELV